MATWRVSVASVGLIRGVVGCKREAERQAVTVDCLPQDFDWAVHVKVGRFSAGREQSV